MEEFLNPFRPAAGIPPPHLAGRDKDKEEFRLLLAQKPILKNLIITGLRGVGKTVLLETLKPIALEKGWFWAGNDLSEQASVSEHSLAIRILADLSSLVSSFVIEEKDNKLIGFNTPNTKVEIKLTYPVLIGLYQNAPGLASDKLKSVLEIVWNTVKSKVKGIVLAYDEAQILKDKASDKEYPLSVLLEITQYLQKKEIPYLLILTGLPTLFPNLVEARTYAERMFRVLTLDKLTDEESKEAILTPIQKDNCPVTFNEYGIKEIIRYSSGYPYFIQFFCKEFFDSFLQQIKVGIEFPSISFLEIARKLDTDFYSGRYSKVTDRQRELLTIIAKLPSANEEFTVKDISSKSIEVSAKPFKSAYINNLLLKLIDFGLIYKNKRGKYSFAVPLLADYINRQEEENILPK